MGINNSGQVVGTTFEQGTVACGYGSLPRGFLSSGGSFSTFSVPGDSLATDALGINNAGQIVGYDRACYSMGLSSYIDSGGNFTYIDAPGASATQASGINDSGHYPGTGRVSAPVGILLALAGCKIRRKRTAVA